MKCDFCKKPLPDGSNKIMVVEGRLGVYRVCMACYKSRGYKLVRLEDA